MISLGRKGQGEGLIKLLVVAIIAIIAIALAKSYFRETTKTAQKSVDTIFAPQAPSTSIVLPIPLVSLTPVLPVS